MKELLQKIMLSLSKSALLTLYNLTNRTTRLAFIGTDRQGAVCMDLELTLETN